MKKSLRFLLLPLVVIMCSTVFAACNSDKNHSENSATFWQADWGGSLQGLPSDRYVPDHLPIPVEYTAKIVMKDTSMLNEFFANTYSQSLNATRDGWERDERFSNAIAKYDDTFFRTKQLVTFFLTASGSSDMFRLTGTTYTNGVLNINIDHFEVDSVHDALVKWFAIVEVDAVPANTTININITNDSGRVFTF